MLLDLFIVCMSITMEDHKVRISKVMWNQWNLQFYDQEDAPSPSTTLGLAILLPTRSFSSISPGNLFSFSLENTCHINWNWTVRGDTRIYSKLLANFCYELKKEIQYTVSVAEKERKRQLPSGSLDKNKISQGVSFSCIWNCLKWK